MRICGSMRFKGKILPFLIKKFNLSKKQAKKLICAISLCDGYGAIYPSRSRWRLETKPNQELHNLVYDLFLYAYNVKILIRFRKKEELQFSELNGKICKEILKDLFKFTPTFKTSPAKRTSKGIQEFLAQPQPTFQSFLNEPKWFKELVMRIIFDLEGCVIPRIAIKKKTYKSKKYFQVQFEVFLKISLAHPLLLKELNQLLKEIGFKFNFQKDSRTWSGSGGLISYRKEDVFRFLKIGGFLTHIRVSKSGKNNNNLFKQTLLKASYKILKNHSVSKYFPTEKEAVQYMKEFKKNILIPYLDKFQRTEENGSGVGREPQ